MSARRLHLAVGACAVVVYLGALCNRFAMDDRYIIGGAAVADSLLTRAARLSAP